MRKILELYGQNPRRNYFSKLATLDSIFQLTHSAMVADHPKTIFTNALWVSWKMESKPSKNHCFQWLPLTIPFNGDSASENHWKFSMVAKTGLKSSTTTTTNFKSEEKTIQLYSPQKNRRQNMDWGVLKFNFYLTKKHCKSAKLPWHHNLKLIFCIFVDLSFCLLFLSFCLLDFCHFV